MWPAFGAPILPHERRCGPAKTACCGHMEVTDTAGRIPRGYPWMAIWCGAVGQQPWVSVWFPARCAGAIHARRLRGRSRESRPAAGEADLDAGAGERGDGPTELGTRVAVTGRCVRGRAALG